MRPNQQNKNRSRGRNGGRKNINPLSRNFESNGPDVKIRGNAAHVAERYVQLARDAQATGDSVMAENYFQHAEHYFRILSAAQSQSPTPVRTDSVFDFDDDDGEMDETVSAESESSEKPEAASGDVGEAGETGPAEPAAAAQTEDGREHTRSRRPRRRRQNQGEDRGDLSGAPQPELPELPAFLTGRNTNAAE